MTSSINIKLFPTTLILVLSVFFVLLQLKAKAQKNETLTKQNNPGHLANNFSYILKDGKRKNLYAIDAKYTLLFFYNPECDACKQYKKMLVSSQMINERVKNGELKVLAIYIDKDLSIWKKYLPEMPKNWIHGRDDNEYLFKNSVYDLHAIPTIYLLDKRKMVILKDVLNIRLIERVLSIK